MAAKTKKPKAEKVKAPEAQDRRMQIASFCGKMQHIERELGGAALRIFDADYTAIQSAEVHKSLLKATELETLVDLSSELQKARDGLFRLAAKAVEIQRNVEFRENGK